MTRGPGRHSELNFRAAEQHYNAAEWPTDVTIIIKTIIIIIIIITCFIPFMVNKDVYKRRVHIVEKK